MSDLPVHDPDLASIADRLASLAALLQRISDEAGPGGTRGAAAVIERHRANVYAAITALGLAIDEFRRTQPAKERMDAARDLVVGTLREWSATSPIFFRNWQGPRQQYQYYELVEQVEEGLASGADVHAMVFSDYYIHSVAATAFRYRVQLLAARLYAEVSQRQAAGERPVRIFSLQYVGGRELATIASNRGLAAGIHITCIDSNAAAARRAEQTCAAAFKGRSRILMAEAEQWLHGPTCPRETASIVYAASLLEQRDEASVMRILEGVYGLLRDGGALIAGSVTRNLPLAEQVMREWMVGWNWRLRGADEWRSLLAQTPFGAGAVTFEHDPQQANVLFTVRRDPELRDDPSA